MQSREPIYHNITELTLDEIAALLRQLVATPEGLVHQATLRQVQGHFRSQPFAKTIRWFIGDPSKPISNWFDLPEGHPWLECFIYMHDLARTLRQAAEASAEAAAEPGTFVLNLTAEPPKLPRYPAAKLPLATQDDVDAAIEAIASADGGCTDRPTIRDWGRHWLREVRRKDIPLSALEARFNDPVHKHLRRPRGRPR